MKVSKKLVELFSHKHAVNKYLNSIDNILQERSVMVFLACGICESESKSDLTYYTIPQVVNLCVKMSWCSSRDNQYPIYREHKLLLDNGFIERLTRKQPYKGQQYCLTLYGRTQLRRLYNYLIRDLYSPL